jgi:hypothetical protein
VAEPDKSALLSGVDFFKGCTERQIQSATLEAITPLHVLVLDPREVDSVRSADPSSARRLGPKSRPYSN